jgi:hypothetical protein
MAPPQELHGYAYWRPVALVIAIVEVLGALSKTFRKFIPWPPFTICGQRAIQLGVRAAAPGNFAVSLQTP